MAHYAVSQTYDNNGNLTGDGTWTYLVDYANRLTSATKSGTSATYQYDAFGRREQKSVNGTVTKYLSDGAAVVEEYNGSGTRTARYAYLPGIDRPLYMERSGTRYYVHQDAQGSVIALTGTNGVVSERYTYSPYGESATTSAAGNPYRYTGRELDAETGLYYYRARYYSTALGRFLSPDPLGYRDSMGLYAYVANDPLNSSDPLGLSSREQLISTHLPAMSVVDAYDRSNPHHAYGTYNQICSNCALSKVVEQQYYANYPFQYDERAVPGEQRRILGLDSAAIVVQEATQPNGLVTLTNQTLPSHVLYDGRVDRTAIQVGTDVYMLTIGYGHNTGPTSAAFNQLIGPYLFDLVDDNLRRRVNGP